MTGRPLVIGYGNVLRADDGVGWYAAERLAGDPRLVGATVIACHQLTPELAIDISQATYVVLVDADNDQPAGTFAVVPVERTGGGAGGSHQLDPGTLLELAGALYGPPPNVVAVRVGVASLAVGDGLSPVVEGVLSSLVDAVAELIQGQLSQGQLSQGQLVHA